jgi:hypothetical protein
MRQLIVVLVLALMATVSSAQGMRDSASVVTVSVAPDTVRASVGETITVTVGMEIDKGWHLYAHGDKTYYGISLNLPEGLPLAGVKVNYPEGHMGKFLGDDVRLLEKTETITLTGILMVAPEKPLDLEFELQACDDKSCLAPAWIPVQVVVLPHE